MLANRHARQKLTRKAHTTLGTAQHLSKHTGRARNVRPKREYGPPLKREDPGAPPGTRTPNPRIKSPLLCVRLLPDNAWRCRFVRYSYHFAAVWYRTLSNGSATSEQTWSKHGDVHSLEWRIR